MQFDVLRRFFLPAMARKCSTPLVEPPKTIVITKAFSKDSLVKRSCGRMFFSMQTLIASAAFAHSRILAGDSAGFDEDPGRHKPIASIAVDIVFAVLWKTLELVLPFLVKAKSAVFDSGVARHVLRVVYSHSSRNNLKDKRLARRILTTFHHKRQHLDKRAVPSHPTTSQWEPYACFQCTHHHITWSPALFSSP
jgi:hypothetical protein